MVLLRSKLAIAALGAVALLWPSRAESPVGATSLPPFSQVTVQHQLIHVPLVAPPRRPVPSRGNAGPRLASGTDRRRPDRGLAARATRLLVGDGRYRPEPFPRPGH
jgi:hypothetical protein